MDRLKKGSLEALPASENACEGMKMKILAVDPGNILSAYAVMELPDFKLYEFGKIDNNDLIERLTALSKAVDHAAIEMIASYGMAVGKSVFDTCVWIGRFWQEMKMNGVEPILVYRSQEKMCLCHSMKAKDSNIRTALIDRYAVHDFKTGRGTKKNPDTFYGVAADVWQAIAVGVTVYENQMDPAVLTD